MAYSLLWWMPSLFAHLADLITIWQAMRGLIVFSTSSPHQVREHYEVKFVEYYPDGRTKFSYSKKHRIDRS